MTRSNIKDFEFYQRQIIELEDLNSNGFQKISAGQIKAHRLKPYSRNILTGKLELVILKYTAGESVGSINPNWESIIGLLETAFIPEGDGTFYLSQEIYVKAIWLLAFGSFLDCTNRDFKKMVAVIDRCGIKDWLLEHLISSRIQGRPQVDTLIFPKPYASLKKAVEETDSAKSSAIVKHYLEKEWYKGHKDTYWYDNHKNSHDVFFGYWSFEAAAVVNIAGIDDRSFRDNEYYPKDLL
ncbi:MAG: PoNe immunity protein domain-containing protein [Bacteroidota bacterium]